MSSERTSQQSHHGAIGQLRTLDSGEHLVRSFSLNGSSLDKQMFRDMQHHGEEQVDFGEILPPSRLEAKVPRSDKFDSGGRIRTTPGVTAVSPPHYSHFRQKDPPTTNGSLFSKGKISDDAPPGLEESENYSFSSFSGDSYGNESWVDHKDNHLSGRDCGDSALGRPTSLSISRPVVLIEVSPGVKAPLRGSNETWVAIKDDFFMPTLCLSCESTIFTIQDAGFVICPTCRVVYPVDDVIDKVAGGVGLGFTYEQLTKWQQDMTRGWK